MRIRALVLALGSALVLGSAPAPAVESPDAPKLRGEAKLWAPEGKALEVTPAMRAWLRDTTSSHRREEPRLRLLARALVDRFRFSTETDSRPDTVSAKEAFEAGNANCVSFSFLFVALAREAGIASYFVLSEQSESDLAQGDLLVSNFHMAVGYGPPKKMVVFDLSGPSTQPHASFRPISDETANAVFLSNRGAEVLLRGQVGSALGLFDRALTLDPSLPLAWTNRGVALRRLGDFGGAEAAYRQAIRLQPASVSAWRNLALLLGQRLQGR